MCSHCRQFISVMISDHVWPLSPVCCAYKSGILCSKISILTNNDELTARTIYSHYLWQLMTDRRLILKGNNWISASTLIIWVLTLCDEWLAASNYGLSHLQMGFMYRRKHYSIICICGVFVKSAVFDACRCRDWRFINRFRFLLSVSSPFQYYVIYEVSCIKL